MKTPNNEQQMATMAMEFLQRVDLKGSEVPAFTMVRQWLSFIAQPFHGDEQTVSEEPLDDDNG